MTRPMTDNKDAARDRAQALRGERAARVGRIRRRVIFGAVTLFVAAWLLITIMLVSGRDPALASKTSTGSSATTVASTPSTATIATSSGDSDSDSDADSSGVSGVTGASGASGVSGVTTSQS